MGENPSSAERPGDNSADGDSWAQELQKLSAPDSLAPAEKLMPVEHYRDGEATYTFAFCEHVGRENGIQAAQVLSSADILAIEHTVDTPQRRAQLEQLCTNYLKPNPSAETIAQFDGWLSNQGSDAFLRGMLQELRGKSQKVQFVDVDESHEVQELFQAGDTAYRVYREQLLDGRIDDASAELTHYVNALSQASTQREQLVIDQLKGMEQAEGHERAKRPEIGVMLGAVHTPVYHELHRNGAVVSRSFVMIDDGRSKAPTEQVGYTLPQQAMRQGTLQSRQAPDPELINQIIMSDLLTIRMIFDAEQPQAVTEKLVRQIPAAEIAQSLAAIDAYRAAQAENRAIEDTAKREQQELMRLYHKYASSS